MKPGAFLQRLRCIPAAARDVSGAAAVEFALIAPVMLTMFFGTAEVSTLVAVQRKATLVAHTLSDLVGQANSVNDAYLNNTFAAGSAILMPYQATPLQAKISAVWIDNNGNATIVWSKAWNKTDGMTQGYTAGTVVTSSIPPGLITNNTELIWSEVNYDYTPIVGYVVKSTISLKDQFYASPRQAAKVDYTS
jgi:Flp pilus assembly protein TadG